MSEIEQELPPASPAADAKPPRPRKTGVTSAARVKGSRDPERTSAAILAAAIKEFTEKGYSGARIEEIAERANVNKRMLYHYFGDKEALYLAVLEGAYVAIRSAEGQLHLSSRDPLEGMRELTKFTWRYFIEHLEFLSILNTENLHKAKYLKRSARIFDLHSPFIALIRDLLERGAAQGVFRPDADPVNVYVSIASLGAFYLSNRYTLSTIFRRDLTSPELLDDWGRHIETVILSYLRP
jgi:AcrR family transcriptional regulator